MLIKELFTWYPNDYHSRTSFFHLHIVSCTCICLNDEISFLYKSFRNELIPLFNPYKIIFLVRNFILVLCKLKTNFLLVFLKNQKIYFKKSQSVFKSWRFWASGAFLRWPEPIYMRVQVICFWIAFFGRHDLTTFHDFWKRLRYRHMFKAAILQKNVKNFETLGQVFL